MAKEYGLAASALGSKPKAAKKSKKTIKEVRHRATKNGGFIVEHHHHDAMQDPVEEHSMPDQDALADHMAANPPQAAPQEAGPEPVAAGGAPPAMAAQ